MIVQTTMAAFIFEQKDDSSAPPPKNLGQKAENNY